MTREEVLKQLKETNYEQWLLLTREGSVEHNNYRAMKACLKILEEGIPEVCLKEVDEWNEDNYGFIPQCWFCYTRYIDAEDDWENWELRVPGKSEFKHHCELYDGETIGWDGETEKICQTESFTRFLIEKL